MLEKTLIIGKLKWFVRTKFVCGEVRLRLVRRESGKPRALRAFAPSRLRASRAHSRPSRLSRLFAPLKKNLAPSRLRALAPFAPCSRPSRPSRPQFFLAPSIFSRALRALRTLFSPILVALKIIHIRFWHISELRSLGSLRHILWTFPLHTCTREKRF